MVGTEDGLGMRDKIRSHITLPTIQLPLSTEHAAHDCQLHSQTITVRGILKPSYIPVTAVQALSPSLHALE